MNAKVMFVALALALCAAVSPVAAETDLVDAELVEAMEAEQAARDAEAAEDAADAEEDAEDEAALAGAADVEAEDAIDAAAAVDAQAVSRAVNAAAHEAESELQAGVTVGALETATVLGGARVSAGWPFSKSCEKKKTCKDCAGGGCVYYYNWALSSHGKHAGHCVKVGADLDLHFSKTKFPVAKAEGECNAAFAKGEELRSQKLSADTTRTTAKLEEFTKGLQNTFTTKYGGKTEFDNCPKTLWHAYLEQEKLEREYGHKTQPVGGVIDYSFEPFGKLGDVMSTADDMKDVYELFKDGVQGLDFAGLAGAAAVKAIQTGIELAAKRVIAVGLLTAKIFADELGPACDLAACINNPKLRQVLEFLDWPYATQAIGHIKCPVCSHIALPMAGLLKLDPEVHAKVLRAATGLVAVCEKVQATPQVFTPTNPFSASKPAKAIQTFLKATSELVGGGYAKKNGIASVDQALADIADAQKAVGAFLQIKQRLHHARQQHPMQPYA